MHWKTFWRLFRGEQRPPENATHPKTQETLIFHSLVFWQQKTKENHPKHQGIFNTQNTKEFPWLEKTKETQNTKEWKIRELTVPKIYVFGCAAFLGVFWCPLSKGNKEHPRTQHTRCEFQCEFLSELRCGFLRSVVPFLGRFK